MPTVPERKIAQCYRTVPNTCSNCASFTRRAYHYENFDVWPTRRLVEGVGDGTNFFEDTFRCSIGSFAVAKMATCNEWSAKPKENCKV